MNILGSFMPLPSPPPLPTQFPMPGIVRRHLQAPPFPEWESPQFSALSSNVIYSVFPWLLPHPIQSLLLSLWAPMTQCKSLIMALVPLDYQGLLSHLSPLILKVPRRTFSVCRSKE